MRRIHLALWLLLVSISTIPGIRAQPLDTFRDPDGIVALADRLSATSADPVQRKRYQLLSQLIDRNRVPIRNNVRPVVELDPVKLEAFRRSLAQFTSSAVARDPQLRWRLQMPATVDFKLSSLVFDPGSGPGTRYGIPLFFPGSGETISVVAQLDEFAESNGLPLDAAVLKQSLENLRIGDGSEKFAAEIERQVIPIVLAGIWVAKSCALGVGSGLLFSYGESLFWDLENPFNDLGKLVKNAGLDCLEGVVTGGIGKGLGRISKHFLPNVTAWAARRPATRKVLKIAQDSSDWAIQARQAVVRGAKSGYFRTVKSHLLTTADDLLVDLTLESIKRGFEIKGCLDLNQRLRTLGLAASEDDINSWSDCIAQRLSDFYVLNIQAFENETTLATPGEPLNLLTLDVRGHGSAHPVLSPGKLFDVYFVFAPHELGLYEFKRGVFNQNEFYPNLEILSLNVTNASQLQNYEASFDGISINTLAALNSGSDPRFQQFVDVYRNGVLLFRSDGVKEEGPGVWVSLNTSEKKIPAVQADVTVNGSLVTFTGSYFDLDNDPATVLFLDIVGPLDSVSHDLKPLLTGSSPKAGQQFQKIINLPNGSYNYAVRASDAFHTRIPRPQPFRVSSTLPVVGIALSKATAAVGEDVAITVTVTDAAGPVPSAFLSLSSSAYIHYQNASGDWITDAATGADGKVTFWAVGDTPGGKDILVRESGNQFGLAKLNVTGSQSADWTQEWSFRAASYTATSTTYDCFVTLKYKGQNLKVAEDVKFQSNHGAFGQTDRQVPASLILQNSFTITKDEANAGNEVFTLTLWQYGAVLTFVTNLTAGPPEPLSSSRITPFSGASSQPNATHVALSPDGASIATISQTQLRRFRTADSVEIGQPISFGATANKELTAVAFSPDGTRVVVGHVDGYVSIVNVASGDNSLFRQMTNGSMDITNVHWYSLTRIAVTTEGSTTGPYNAQIKILDANLNQLRSFPIGGAGEDDIDVLRCSSVLNWCAAATGQGTRRWGLFNAESGASLASGTHPDPGNPILAFEFNPEGTRFLVGGWSDNGNPFLKLYNTIGALPSLLASPLTGSGNIYGAAFLKDEQGIPALALAGNSGLELFSVDGGDSPGRKDNTYIPTGGARDNLRLQWLSNTSQLVAIESARQVYFNFDRFGPSINTQSSYELPFSVTSLSVQGTIVDSAGISSAEYVLNGGSAIPVLVSNSFLFSFSITNLPVGDSTLLLTARDAAGNATSFQISIKRLADKSGPLVSAALISPSNVAVGSSPAVSANVVDLESAVNSVKAIVRDLENVSLKEFLLSLSSGTQTYSAAFSAVGLSPGLYWVDIIATDTASPANQTSSLHAIQFLVEPAPITISGVVTKNGVPLAGVTFTLSGGPGGTQTTTASGSYSFPALPVGNNYTLTPSLANHSFSPPVAAFNNPQAHQTANFTATAGAFTITGQITRNGLPQSGVVVTLSGGPGGALTTTASGIYTYSSLPGGSNYTVTPSLTNHTFAPAAYSFNNLQLNQDAPFNALPFSITVLQGSGQSANVSSPFTTPLQAKVTDAAGTPRSGVLVTFAPPSSGASATVPAGNVASTNSLGIASAAVTANGIAGTYIVAASATGLSAPANFTLTNAPIIISSQPPVIVSGTPNNPTASPQIFTFTTRDPDGFSDIDRIFFLINSNSASLQGACHGLYDRPTNSLYLYNDTLTLLLGPVTPGAATTIENGQCSITGTGSALFAASGTDLAINLNIALKSPFAAASQKIFVLAKDKSAKDSGWIQTGTWTIPNPILSQPPVIVSGTPSNPVAATQTFTFTARDPNGFANIYRLYFLVNGNSNIPQNTCHGFYDRQLNTIHLYNDALTAFTGPLTPGATGKLENSQCSINGAASALFQASGNDLSLNLDIGLKGAYLSKNNNIYVWARDNESNDTGWVQTGTWTPIGNPNLPPAVVSGTPAATGANPQTFTFTARDPNGFSNLYRLYFLVNSTSSIPQNTCHGFYDRQLNTIHLYNDALTAFTGPLTPGAPGKLENSQCAINGSASALFQASGNDLSLRLDIGLKGTYAAKNQNVYLWARDFETNDTGWVQTGTWTGSSVDPQPVVVSGLPANATSSPQTFTFTGRDLNGFANIYRMYFLVNPNSSIPPNTCHGFYDRSLNAIYLYNDALNALLGPLTPGSQAKIENSQCVINGAASALYLANGTDLAIKLDIGLKGAFASTAQKVYLWIRDNEAHDTGWIQTSSWAPGPGAIINQPPVVISGTPANASASPQTFSFTSRDPDGFANIYRLYFLVNANATIPQNTCHGFYDRATNSIYLYNDALSALLGPLTPGTAGTIQNSQCAINGVGSALYAASGVELVLNLNIGLKNPFASSPKGVYLWAQDKEANGTGWQQTGTWNVAGNTGQFPVVVSGTPNQPVSSPQIFTFTGRDPDGFANIARLYFLINPNSSIPQNTCHGFYDRSSNSIYLYNDALSALIGPLTPGTAGTLQNTQCLISGANSALFVASGNDLAVNLEIGLRGAFAKTQQRIYLWFRDNEAHDTGWVQTGLWSIP